MNTMKNVFFAIVAGYVAGMLISGCGQEEAVLARIGDEKISEKEFQRQVEHSPAQYEGYLVTSLGKQKYLDVLVNEKIVVHSAKQEGLHKDPLVNAEMDEMRQEFQRQLGEYQEKLLIRTFLEKHRDEVLYVSDEEIKQFSAKNSRMFENPVEVTISHILLDSELRAQDVLKRIKKGARFNAMVKQYSLDELTREKGGVLPPLTEGNIMAAFKDVVFALKENEISGIIKSDFGYHIIKKLEEKKLPPVPEEEAVEQARMMLEKEKFVAFIEKRKKDLNVHVNYDYFEKADK